MGTLCRSFPYQPSVKPPHVCPCLFALKLSRATKNSGIYRRAMPTQARTLVAPGRRRLDIIPTSAHTAENGEAHDARNNEDYPEHRSERPVARGAELLLNEVADKHILRAAEEIAHHVHSEARNERKNDGGDDSRHHLRKNAVVKNAERRRIEIAGRFDNIPVEAFDARVKRKNGEGKHGTQHADVNGERAGIERIVRTDEADRAGYPRWRHLPAEHEHPCVSADHEVRAARHHHEREEKRTRRLLAVRDPERHREREQEAERRRHEREDETPHDDMNIIRGPAEGTESGKAFQILEGERPVDAAVGAALRKGEDDEPHDRKKQKDDEPEHSRSGEQKSEAAHPGARRELSFEYFQLCGLSHGAPADIRAGTRGIHLRPVRESHPGPSSHSV